MPGDVVLGRDGGVIFIPPHLAENVVKTSEIVRLRDLFGHQRLREIYARPDRLALERRDREGFLPMAE
jgi:regulator of RNase E activity RraA